MKVTNILVLAALEAVIFVSRSNITYAQTYVGSCFIDDADYVSISGQYAFVTSPRLFFSADISDPSNPHVVDWIPHGNSVSHIFISKDYAYVSGFSQSLKIINITDPANMVLVSEFDPDYEYTYIHCSYVRGNIAYLAGCHRLIIIDVTDKTNPIELSHSQSQFEDTRGIWVEGNVAYVPDFMDAVFGIFDVTNPIAPNLISATELYTYWSHYFMSRDNYVYIANGHFIRIIDTENPSQPVVVDSISGFNQAVTTFLHNNNLFVADHELGLFVYGIGDPAHPVLEGFYGAHCRSIYANDNYIYIDNDDSLTILSYDSTPIFEDNAPLPSNAFMLHAYPNPYNSSTIIFVNGMERADIGIFDIAGRRIALLHAENGSAVWDASGFSSGAYFARIVGAGELSNTLKLLYIK